MLPLGLRTCVACYPLLACLTACENTAKEAPATPTPAPAQKAAPPAASQPKPPAKPAVPALPDGKLLPFEYENHATTAKAGEFVLAPTQSTVEEAIEVGAERQAFIYYGGVLESADETTSVVKSSAGRRSRLANALVLPIGPASQAKVGDIVLTAWASGTGLQRGIVVEGGTPEAPKVRYLDMTLDNPSGWGQKEDALPKGSFRVLTKPGQLGSTLACQDKNRHTRQIVVGRSGGKLLGLGFAGKLAVFDDKACQSVPIQPKLKVGDSVRVPVLAVFTAAKVSKLDPKIGRVWAKYAHGSEERERAFGFANVWPSKD